MGSECGIRGESNTSRAPGRARGTGAEAAGSRWAGVVRIVSGASGGAAHLNPPDLNNVWAYWRWYYEVVMWPAAPKTFRGFWEKVESSTLLKLLCESEEYEDKWKDPLLYHLGQMWMAGPVRGRLEPENEQAVEPSRSVMWSIAVLELIVQGLIASGTARRDVQHAEASLLLLKDFFPQDCVASWTPDDLRDRIAHFGRIPEDQFIDVLSSASACRKQIDEKNVPIS